MAFRPDRLREARESLRDHGRRLSQDRFADLIGVSHRSPQRWENGEAEPRMAQLVRIAEVTGRPVGFFFGSDDPETNHVEDARGKLAEALLKVGNGLEEIADLVETLNGRVAEAARAKATL